MARRRGISVRIGPASVLTLVVAVCLAVLAVLSVTTAEASLALSQRQASFTQDGYANEAAGQALVAEVDEALQPARQAGSGAQAAAAELDASIGALSAAALDAVSVDEGQPLPHLYAWVEGTSVYAQIEAESGRRLDIQLNITDTLQLETAAWKASTSWTEGGGETLWTG